MKGELRPTNEVGLALFVERHLVGAARSEALEALIARNAGDSDVQEKIREVLARG